MKLVWHIVWKDLRRLRWWALAWIAVLALPVVQGFVLLYRNPLPIAPGTWTPSQIQNWLRIFEAVAAYLLTLVLLQEDAVAGTRQFWVTRPISNTRLLAAKVLGLVVVFIALPIAISLPWWLWCGFGGSQIGPAAFELILSAALVVLPAAAIAVITDSLGRALLWTLVFIAVVFANVAWFTTVIRSGHDVATLATRVVLSVTLVLVELAGIVLLRFLLRARMWPVVVLLAVMAGSVWFARSVSWVWFTEPRPVHPERAAALELGEPTFTERNTRVTGRLFARQVDVVFPIRQLPSEGNLVGLYATQQWRVGEMELAQPYQSLGIVAPFRNELGLHAPPADPETTAAWTKHWKERDPDRPVPRLSADDPIVDPRITEYTTLPRAVVAAGAAEPLGFRTRMWFALERAELGAETQLEERRWHAGRGVGLRVHEVYDVGDVLAADVVSTAPVTVSTWMTGVLRPRMRAIFDPRLIAIHRGRGEVGQARPDKPVVMTVNGVAIAWARVSISGGRIFRGMTWLQRPGWREGVSLGVVEPYTVAVFSRDVEVPHVKFEVRDETKETK